MIRGFVYPTAVLFGITSLAFVVAFGLSMVADWNHYTRVKNWVTYNKPWEEFPIDPEESSMARAERHNAQLAEKSQIVRDILNDSSNR